MSLSSASSIQNSVQRSVNDYSAVDTMGSLVGNREFGRGYCEFACGQTTSKSYIWQALSAASQSLGEEVYSNVLHYIDNISNVDVCKVKSLMSMLKLIDSNYLMLDKVQHYPIEVQKLIDILSINKRYLLDNTYIKQSFIDDMASSGAISNVLSVYDTSCIVDISALANGNISSSLTRYVYDKTAFDKYLSSTFYNFMLDMLDMEIVPDDQMCAFVQTLHLSSIPYLSGASYDDMLSYCKAYKQITVYDGYGPNAEYNDKYAQQKKMCNIDMSFDVAAEVDAIELGQTSIDEYYGDELSLVIEEINSRKTALNNISGLSVSNMMTRNAYYRKRKVIEYAKFIDSLVGSSPAISAYETYRYDPNYYLNPSCDMLQSYSLSFDGASVVGIVSADVAKAARNLVAIVNYIAKIRQVIRQQVRKVFMKGTNNLLEYAVNEFIVDYANQLTDVFDIEDVSAIVSKLSAHRVADVKVQEYWDNTEYFNISTDTSNSYAYNYNRVNSRYFDDVFQRDANGKLVPREEGIFTNDEINEFYLSTLGMKNTMQYLVSSNQQYGSAGLSSNFYDFLSVLFDVAANPSYYDIQNDVFGSKLSSGVITHNIYDDLKAVKDISAVIMSAASTASYEFPSDKTIKQQRVELFDQFIGVMQGRYLSAVSATYDTYAPQAQSLSAQLASIESLLSTYLTQQYSAYFCKSLNPYCYDEDGSYKYSYFVDNSSFGPYDLFVTKLGAASAWIQDNCFTYALSSVIDDLSSTYLSVQSDINALTSQVKASYKDYTDMQHIDLEKELQSIKDFIDQKISLRTQFLQSALDNFRNQATQLKSSYDQCVVSFQNVLASMPDTSQGYYFTWLSAIDSNDTLYKISPTPNISAQNREYIYDQYSQCIFATKVDGDDLANCHWTKKDFNPEYDVKEDATLRTNVNNTKNRLDECSEIYYGFIGPNSSFPAPSTTASRSYGTQKEALDAILMSLNDIIDTHNMVVDGVKQIFGVGSELKTIGGDQAGSSNDTDIVASILKLQSFLAAEITDADFANDKLMKSLNEFIVHNDINDTWKGVNVISAETTAAQINYESVLSEFASFLQDYEKDDDYNSFILPNLQKMSLYRADKDQKSLNQINASFSSLNDSYSTIVSQFIEMCDQRIQLYSSPYATYTYEYSGKALEYCLSDIVACLQTDVLCKTAIGNAKIDSEWSIVSEAIDDIASGERATGKVGLYRKYFPEDLVPLTATYTQYEDAFNSQVIPFTAVLDKLLDHLDYTREQFFDTQRLMFQNYTGMTAKTISADKLIAADPYYNYKNVTHPSYQIHPFLWNFSENIVVQHAIDVVSRVFADINIAALEGALVQSNLDKYIGQFGNVIDIWKNNTRDFTSYTTRYEQSDHVCRYTSEWSEVVDYDGAFYPPALSTYLAGDKSYASVSSWYAHLSVDHDSKMLSRLSCCLSVCYNAISSIASDKLLKDVDDIFKYQVDTYGNMYILYKRYAHEDVPYYEKLSACGQLWIRLADSPIAFPLSSIVDVDSCAKDLDQGVGNEQISSWHICDFEILPTGDKICIAYKDTTTGLVKIYPLDIHYDVLLQSGIGNLYFTKGPQQSMPFPIRLVGEDAVMHYLGMYPRSTTEVDAVYIDANATLDSNGIAVVTSLKDQPYVYVYQVYTDMTSQLPTSIEVKMASSSIIGTNAAIAYYESQDKSGHLAVSFAVQTSLSAVDVHRVEQPSISVDLDKRPDGYVYDDALHSEMNSFDVFNQTVVLETIDFSSDLAHRTQYQTNADMGYTPSYAGLSGAGPLSIASEIDVSHQAIELLGKSKDLDQLTGVINGTPNPYMTKDEINDKFLYGRVWENGAGALSSTAYNAALDRSLNILLNMSFYQNMPVVSSDDGNMSQCYASADNSFLQDVSLSSMYDLSDLQRLKLVMYSTCALGKDLYLLGDLSALSASSGGQFIDVNYDLCSVQDDVSASMGIYTVKFAGTYNGIDEDDCSFSNVLPNISSIAYSCADGHFKVKYKLSSDMPSFIEPGMVRIALVNANDIRFIEWFHLMDTGARYDGIPEPLCQVTTSSMYVPSAEMLAIDLSKYDALSDVNVECIDGEMRRILDTYNKMTFKVDESDIFPTSSFNYYIPSINIKYPLTFGQAYDQYCILHYIDRDALVKVFKPDELYVIDAQDPSDVSSAGSIQFIVPYADDSKEVIAYEDYLSAVDGIANDSRYGVNDPLMYQYAMFFGPASSDQPLGISVDQTSSWQHVYVEHSYGNYDYSSDAFSQFLSVHSLCAVTSELMQSQQAAQHQFSWSSASSADLQRIMAKISKLLRLYFNYKKTPDGIVLYANYQNYINTPFVKVVNGKPYIDTIPGTYAKVMPGAVEDLDVIVQFRQYFREKLMSCINMTVATYQIYNISDDKPKFILKKVHGVRMPSDERQYAMSIVAQQVDALSSQQVPFMIAASSSSYQQLTAELSCIVGFASDALSVDYAKSTVKRVSSGTFQMVFSRSQPQHMVSFGFVGGMNDIAKQLPVDIIDVQADTADEIEVVNGYVKFLQ